MIGTQPKAKAFGLLFRKRKNIANFSFPVLFWCSSLFWCFSVAFLVLFSFLVLFIHKRNHQKNWLWIKNPGCPPTTLFGKKKNEDPKPAFLVAVFFRQQRPLPSQETGDGGSASFLPSLRESSGGETRGENPLVVSTSGMVPFAMLR